jgi:hypothetical protein
MLKKFRTWCLLCHNLFSSTWSFDSTTADSSLYGARAAIYSVSTDSRADKWEPDVPENLMREAPSGFIATRTPILKVVLAVDLSEPEDLSLVGLLLYKPLPMELEIYPVYTGSRANEILVRCYDTIFQNVNDAERARDFLRALDQWTWGYKQPDKWEAVTERAARLACQVFSKDLESANSILEDIGVSDFSWVNHRNLSRLSGIVNDVRIENITADSLFSSMVALQSRWPILRDEL